MSQAGGALEAALEQSPAELTAEAILATATAPPQPLYVPEWGGTVYVREMSGAERDAFEAASLAGRGKGATFNAQNIRARLACACICRADGVRLFRDDQADELGAKSARALNRIFEVAAPLNGLTESDVEQLAGKSAAGLSD